MHLGKRTAIRVQALETRAFHHGVALQNIFADGPWAFPCSLEDGKFQKNIIPPSKIVDRGGGGNSKVLEQRMQPWWWLFRITCFGKIGVGAYGFLREAGTDIAFYEIFSF